MTIYVGVRKEPEYVKRGWVIHPYWKMQPWISSWLKGVWWWHRTTLFTV
jgi:hypothetical protein